MEEGIGIHSAACSGDIESLITILSKNKSIINEVNQFGMTPLHGASFHGQLETARILLDNGADPNHPSSGPKYTYPLHLAVTRLHRPLVELLIVEGKADPSLKDYIGQTILDVAQGISVETDSVAKDPETNIQMMKLIKECIVKSAATKGIRRPFKSFSYESKHLTKKEEVKLNDNLSDFGDYNDERIDPDLKDQLMYHYFKSGIL